VLAIGKEIMKQFQPNVSAEYECGWAGSYVC
jgi:hypothetical protein